MKIRLMRFTCGMQNDNSQRCVSCKQEHQKLSNSPLQNEDKNLVPVAQKRECSIIFFKKYERDDTILRIWCNSLFSLREKKNATIFCLKKISVSLIAFDFSNSFESREENTMFKNIRWPYTKIVASIKLCT